MARNAKRPLFLATCALCALFLFGCAINQYTYDGKSYSKPNDVYAAQQQQIQGAAGMLPAPPAEPYGTAVIALNSRQAVEQRALTITGAPNRNVVNYLVDVVTKEEQGIADLIRDSGLFSHTRVVTSEWTEDAPLGDADYIVYHHIPTPSAHQWYLKKADWDAPKPIHLDMGQTTVSARLASIVASLSETLEESTVRMAAQPTDQPAPADVPDPLKGQRYAVVIGVSDYHDSRIPSLRYAADDANAFYQWLVTTGGYAPSNVKLLSGKEATAQNIRSALFDWLRQALEEDMVLIYFAGHGSPDSPDSSENLYLLPYDTDYANIVSTAFPMWDIQTALKRFIKAKKCVVIADACHSGGVGQEFDVARRANRGVLVNPISLSLQNLSDVSDGICVISASDNKQTSQESQKWGGGHGVFTWYLLNGLNGDADYDRNNAVTLGELIPYLSQSVRKATTNAQSPTVAGQFDPALTISR